jgi:hypothetical protein
MNQLVPFTDHVPPLAAAAGERASYRFFEFFTAQIRNQHDAALRSPRRGSDVRRD